MVLPPEKQQKHPDNLNAIWYNRVIYKEQKKALDAFLRQLDLPIPLTKYAVDRTAKTGQILAYLDAVHAQLRQFSSRRRVVCIEGAAGNPLLSFLVYYYYTALQGRPLAIHCIDTNAILMDKARRRAQALQFDHLHFHTGDIADFHIAGRVDMVYALHACGTATDKALHLGLRHHANCIMAVPCCQHSLRRQMRGHPLKQLTKHSIFKEKIAYMVGDALRALLLEMQGYKVDIIEFASSRYTEKNALIRARRSPGNKASGLWQEYVQLRDAFHLAPPLESYLNMEGKVPARCQPLPQVAEATP
ncbi:MAG: methyltransferase [Candidatus Latescibacteria bacterium]|nr:methyltransferase [Candidatus Latescibacterota bacterium]